MLPFPLPYNMVGLLPGPGDLCWYSRITASWDDSFELLVRTSCVCGYTASFFYGFYFVGLPTTCPPTWGIVGRLLSALVVRPPLSSNATLRGVMYNILMLAGFFA